MLVPKKDYRASSLSLLRGASSTFPWGASKSGSEKISSGQRKECPSDGAAFDAHGVALIRCTARLMSAR